MTGAGGMLGQALMAALDAAGHQALGLTREDADVRTPGALRESLRTFRPEWIFHLAAFTKVDDCETHADEAHLVNVLGSRNVAQAAAEAEIPLLAVSTDYVFDGTARTPYREYDTPAPRSVYGASKLAGERAVRELHPRHVIVRTAWLYGKGGPNFVDTIRRRAVAGETLRVVDDQRGSPTSTADLAPALLRLAEAGQFGTYHCTNSGTCTWHDLASAVVEREGSSVTVERIDTATLGRPAPRPAYSVLGNLLYEEVTGHRMPHWLDALDRHLRPQDAPDAHLRIAAERAPGLVSSPPRKESR